MKVLFVDNRGELPRDGKVHVELTLEEVHALWQAVKDNDLYESWWTPKVQSQLFSDLQDCFTYSRAVPPGCAAKIVDVVKDEGDGGGTGADHPDQNKSIPYDSPYCPQCGQHYLRHDDNVCGFRYHDEVNYDRGWVPGKE